MSDSDFSLSTARSSSYSLMQVFGQQIHLPVKRLLRKRGFCYELSHRMRFEVNYAKQEAWVTSKTVLLLVPNLK